MRSESFDVFVKDIRLLVMDCDYDDVGRYYRQSL